MEILSLIGKLVPVFMQVIIYIVSVALAVSKIKELTAKVKMLEEQKDHFKDYLFDQTGVPYYLSVQAFNQAMLTRNETIKAISAMQSSLMSKEQHLRDCENAQLRAAGVIQKSFEVMSDKVIGYIDVALKEHFKMVDNMIERFHPR